MTKTEEETATATVTVVLADPSWNSKPPPQDAPARHVTAMWNALPAGTAATTALLATEDALLPVGKEARVTDGIVLLVDLDAADVDEDAGAVGRRN